MGLDIAALKPGDLIQHVSSGEGYIVAEVNRERGSAFVVRFLTATNPDEWRLHSRAVSPDGLALAEGALGQALEDVRALRRHGAPPEAPPPKRCWRCERRIEPGDVVRQTEIGGYVEHAVCPVGSSMTRPHAQIGPVWKEEQGPMLIGPVLPADYELARGACAECGAECEKICGRHEAGCIWTRRIGSPFEGRWFYFERCPLDHGERYEPHSEINLAQCEEPVIRPHPTDSGLRLIRIGRVNIILSEYQLAVLASGHQLRDVHRYRR